MVQSENKNVVETDRITSFYEDYVNQNEISAGWSTGKSAENAYMQASNCSAQHWSEIQSVLDVGSGEGHLLQFLRSQRHFLGQYTGLELLPFFHHKAVELYGQQDKAEFILAEFLSYNFSQRKFDWVVSLGGLAVKQQNQHEYDLAFCRKMIALAQQGVSIYLNDAQYMRSERLEQFPDLAAHDIDDFVLMLKQECPDATIDVTHYPSPHSQNTMIHLIM